MADRPEDLSVVVPVYHEARTLARRMGEVMRYLSHRHPGAWELVLVDDGSRDHTLDVARALTKGRDGRVRVLYHRPNRGKGYSVRRGMLAATGRRVLFTDADLSTPIEELDELERAMSETGAPVVIGSRAVRGARLEVRQPWPRELMGRLGNRAIGLLARELRGIHDTQCGFKLFTREAARALFSRARIDRWGFDFEILALARRMGMKVVEVPVVWRHDPSSKVRPLDYLRTLVELVRVAGGMP